MSLWPLDGATYDSRPPAPTNRGTGKWMMPSTLEGLSPTKVRQLGSKPRLGFRCRCSCSSPATPLLLPSEQGCPHWHTHPLPTDNLAQLCLPKPRPKSYDNLKILQVPGRRMGVSAWPRGACSPKFSRPHLRGAQSTPSEEELRSGT